MGQLEDMQVFIRVVEAGGIGRAAEQLDIAKSAVSRRLSELEKRLGVRLMNRTTRTSSLTEAGESYYQQVLKVVDQVVEINSDLQGAECRLAGTIRIAVPLSFGLLHLSSVIDLFVKQHPEVNIHIDFSDRQVDLIEDRFDLALRIARLKDSSNQARKICPCHHVMVASPAYLEEMGVPRSPADLEQHRYVKYSGSGEDHVAITNAKGKRQRAHLVSSMVSNNGDFILKMACAGHGIVVLPTFIVSEAVASGALLEVLPDWSLPSLDAWLVYPRNRYLPRRVRLLIDFVVEHFGDKPYWDEAINKA